MRWTAVLGASVVTIWSEVDEFACLGCELDVVAVFGQDCVCAWTVWRGLLGAGLGEVCGV